MLPKIINQDPEYDEWCEEEIKNSYKKAAEYDEFIFGDYDYINDWKETFTNDVI